MAEYRRLVALCSAAVPAWAIMSPRSVAAVSPELEFVMAFRRALMTAASIALLASSTAHAQCTTRDMGGGFVSYNCADGRSGTAIVPGGATAKNGSVGPKQPSTNVGAGITKRLFGDKSGISQRVSPDVTIHRYGGQAGYSIDRGGGIVTHHGTLFESRPIAPPRVAPTPARAPVAPRSGRPARRRGR